MKHDHNEVLLMILVVAVVLLVILDCVQQADIKNLEQMLTPVAEIQR